jgi:hypothetical protein
MFSQKFGKHRRQSFQFHLYEKYRGKYLYMYLVDWNYLQETEIRDKGHTVSMCNGFEIF